MIRGSPHYDPGQRGQNKGASRRPQVLGDRRRGPDGRETKELHRERGESGNGAGRGDGDTDNRWRVVVTGVEANSGLAHKGRWNVGKGGGSRGRELRMESGRADRVKRTRGPTDDNGQA